MSRREKHLRELAEITPNVRRINFHRGLTPDGTAWYDGTIDIRGWNPRNQAAYFAGLHELGHLALGHVFLPKDRADMVNREADAWDWAMKNSREAPNRKTLAHIRDHWLGSYVRNMGPGTTRTFNRIASMTGVIRPDVSGQGESAPAQPTEGASRPPRP